MPSLSGIFKCALIALFVWTAASFVGSRVFIFFAAQSEHVTRLKTATFHCNVCNVAKLPENSGEFGMSCGDACRIMQDNRKPWEVGAGAVIARTYLCGSVPCEEVFAHRFSFTFLAFVVMLLYGLRYTLILAGSAGGSAVAAQSLETPKRDDSFYPLAPLWWVASVPLRLVSFALSTVGSMAKTLEVESDAVHDHDI